MTALLLIMALIMFAMAIFAILHKSIKAAIIASGVISLFASVIYVILSAPDVAITEASIGSALTVVIFFIALKKIRQADDQK